MGAISRILLKLIHKYTVKIVLLKEKKLQQQKEEKEKFIPVVAVEEQHLPDLLTPVTSLNLFEDEIDTEQTILSKFKVDEDAYKGVNITPEKVKKVKKLQEQLNHN